MGSILAKLGVMSRAEALAPGAARQALTEGRPTKKPGPLTAKGPGFSVVRTQAR